jgi:hypothetical protein
VTVLDAASYEGDSMPPTFNRMGSLAEASQLIGQPIRRVQRSGAIEPAAVF